jgi:pimeloyl-ACP methyl ester carboxylesterase
MEVPETRFTRIGGERIGYQVFGEGPDLIYFSGMTSSVDVRWDHPEFAAFLRRMGSFCRLIGFDRRGTGVSDALSSGQSATWETFVDDVRAVLDDVGSERACVFAHSDAGPTGMLFAASHPDRTSALIAGNTTARLTRAPDYPVGFSPEQADEILHAVEERWGSERLAALAVPSRSADPAFARWYAKFQRASMRPRDAAAHLRELVSLDVRATLPLIRVPTLIMHALDLTLIPADHGRYVADAIEGARFVGMPSADIVIWAETAELVLAEVEEFVTGFRHNAETDRVLATVLFTDIVASTERAAELGDRRWREVLHNHEQVSAEIVSAFRGRLVKNTGDGILATFDGPARALRCAGALRIRLRELGLGVRMGVHTGEIELMGDDVGGIGVNIGSRVMSEADPRFIDRERSRHRIGDRVHRSGDVRAQGRAW